jgi:hypothetical protein
MSALSNDDTLIALSSEYLTVNVWVAAPPLVTLATKRTALGGVLSVGLVKFAVTLRSPFIATVVGLPLPDASPLQELKLYPATGPRLAVRVTTVPVAYFPSPPDCGLGVIEPAPGGSMFRARLYRGCVKFAVTLRSPFIVTVV